MPPEKTWSCEFCGSENIQVAVWTRPNTGEILWDDQPPCGEPVWCDDCENDYDLLKEPGNEDS